MDLSKLPRLSKSETPPPATPVESTTPPPMAAAPATGAACPYCAAPLRAGARFCDSCGTALRRAPESGAVGMGAEAWISIGLGLLLLFLNPTLLQYASSKMFHTKFTPFADLDGNPSDSVHYFKNDDLGNKVLTEKRHYLKTNAGDGNTNFPSDLAITLFALALILEGVALVLSRKPVVIMAVFALTVVATVYNLIYFIGTYSHYKTIPMISALAILFGGYMAMYQFSLLQSVRVQSRN